MNGTLVQPMGQFWVNRCMSRTFLMGPGEPDRWDEFLGYYIVVREIPHQPEH